MFWALAATAIAAVTAVSVHGGGAFTLTGPSVGGQALSILAGVLVMALGGLRIPFRPGRRLMGVAGGAWLASEWANPAAPNALVFTVGLAAGGAFLPLFLVAALPSRPQDRGRLRRPALLAAALSAVIAGPMSTVLADPIASGCPGCPADLMAVSSAASAAGLARFAAVLAVLACCFAAAAALRPVDPRRQAGLLVVIVGAAADGSVLAAYGPGSPLGHAVHVALAVSLIAYAVGEVTVAWSARRALRAVARAILSASVVEHPAPVQDVLGGSLKDPALRVLYPASAGWVNHLGAPVSPPEAAAVWVTDGPVVLAAVTGASTDSAALSVLTAALDRARLQLDVERIQAGEQSRAAELRTAGRRAAEAAYLTRVGLERDLHDGAQQLLVALRFTLGLLRARSERAGAGRALAAADEADAAAEAALDRLRDLAHGMAGPSGHPAGPIEAVRSVAERAGATFRVEGSDFAGDADPVSPLVAWVAYSVVADVLDAGQLAEPIEVSWHRARTHLVAVVTGEAGDAVVPATSGEVGHARPVASELADRVELVGGQITTNGFQSRVGRRSVRLVLPCE